jgi:N-acetylglucosamine-6-sulfatase
MELPPVSPWVSRRMDIAFRNRSSSLLDLDYLIGVVLDGALALDPGLKNTFFVFSSDNGFHLGEHRMPFGKEHPYQTDVSVPMYIAGPGVPAGAALAYPTTHIDLTATLVELAGAVPSQELEGLSFAAAFSPSPPTPQAWRPWQFAEHHCGKLTWRSLRWPLRNVTYSMWCGDGSGSANGAEEVFEHAADPWELANIAADGGPGAAEVALSGPLAEYLWTCTGKECHTPSATPVSGGAQAAGEAACTPSSARSAQHNLRPHVNLTSPLPPPSVQVKPFKCYKVTAGAADGFNWDT